MPSTDLYIKSLIDRGKWHDYRQGIWGDSYNWDFIRSTTQVKYPTIHHSVTKHEATPDDIALLHKARGWGGIGYHFVITKDGIVHYVGDMSTGRANVAGRNHEVIGICMVGDFTKHLPSDDQIMSAHDLVKFFIEQPNWQNVNGWEDLRGHKDFNPTACPGSSFPNDMRDRIVDRRVYTPQPDPVPTPTPEPPPSTDDFYRVTHRGKQLGAYKENPITKINDLETKVKSLEDNMQKEIELAKKPLLDKMQKARQFISSGVSNLQGADKQLS